MSCLLCEGPLELLGVLGDRSHYRCRCCGMQFSFVGLPTGDDEAPEEDESPTDAAQP